MGTRRLPDRNPTLRNYGVDRDIGETTEVEAWQSQMPVRLDEREAKICTALQSEPLYFDKLLQATELSISELSACLTMLELDGLITRLPGDRYSLASSRKAANSSAPTNATSVLPAAVTTEVDSAISFLRTIYQGGEP